MSAEENKALVRRFLKELAEGNLDVIDELLSPDFVDHSLLPGQASDREGYKRSMVGFRAPFSNIDQVIYDQISEGDKVVTRYTVSATHDRGEILGVAPTGREVTISGVLIHRISDGKIAEEWSEGDLLNIMLPAFEQETRERERVEQELRVARRIQQALLPKAVPVLAGWEISHHYQPAREVGGDFYDFFPLVDGRVGLVIGDVSGKGIAAAVVMASTRSVLRAVAQRGGSAPGQVLAEANEVLRADIPPNMFATCFYAILDPESGSLSYANAGHNLPCYRSYDGPVTHLRATGMPLGLMTGLPYEEKETVLALGDGVLFYSDGLVEAHDSRGEMFGSPRLRRLLEEHGGDGKALGAFLLEELERFTGEAWEQEDDITLLMLRRSTDRAGG